MKIEYCVYCIILINKMAGVATVMCEEQTSQIKHSICHEKSRSKHTIRESEDHKQVRMNWRYIGQTLR